MKVAAAFAVILPLVSADLIMLTTTNGDGQQDFDYYMNCKLATVEDECGSYEYCDWIYGECLYRTTEEPIQETCGFINDKKTCGTNSDCIWMSDARDPRPNAEGYCAEKSVISEGDCASTGYVIRSKKACNSVKGCSWFGGDLDQCMVALTQLDCDVVGDDKATCRQEGCESKIIRKRRTCRGRWEHVFFKTLVGMDGSEAKQAIEGEYGEDTYNVVLVNPGERLPRGKVRSRIKMLLNLNGSVKRAPRFG